MAEAADHLPEDGAALKAALIKSRAKLSGAEALIAHLQLTIEKMKRAMFGPRSERSQRLIDQLELQLEELAAAAGEDEAKAEAPRVQVQGFTRRSGTRRNFPADLPRRRIVHPAPSLKRQMNRAHHALRSDWRFPGLSVADGRRQRDAGCTQGQAGGRARRRAAQAWTQFTGRPAQRATFTARWLYAVIRHTNQPRLDADTMADAAQFVAASQHLDFGLCPRDEVTSTAKRWCGQTARYSRIRSTAFSRPSTAGGLANGLTLFFATVTSAPGANRYRSSR